MTNTGPPQPTRRFFLAAPLDERSPRLFAGEAEHAIRVLRMRVGDELLGLDGRGLALPCRIAAIEGRNLELEPSGEPERHPAPGETGAPLPWIEVAVAWPRPSRAPEMVDRLTQLGAAAITPLRAAWGGPAKGLRPDRVLRVLREACKQSGRTWLPEFAPEPLTPGELAAERPGATLLLFDPRDGVPLDTLARGLATDGSWRCRRERPLVLCVGPEGGFDEAERRSLLEAGATAVRVAPHVLRIETAAEAGLAVLGSVLAP